MNNLQIRHVKLSSDYRNEWNEHNKDFVILVNNGVPVNGSLYRVGGFGCDLDQDYFMLLKYVERMYDYDFIKDIHPKKSKKEIKLLRKYLEAHWCIIDKNGVEKKEFEQFETPYIMDNSCVYLMKGHYYNIETGFHYCASYNNMSSSDYLFLENPRGDGLPEKGVMRINKHDGTWIIFE